MDTFVTETLTAWELEHLIDTFKGSLIHTWPGEKTCYRFPGGALEEHQEAHEMPETTTPPRTTGTDRPLYTRQGFENPPTLLPPPVLRMGGKVYRPTIEESCKFFINIQPVGTNMVQHLQTAERKQPFLHILCLGDDMTTSQSALQSSPWGLMQALEHQLGDLRIDTDEGSYEGVHADTGDSRPSSGFYESSEGQSPKGRPYSAEPTEVPVSPWAYSSDRPKSLGDPLMLNGEHLDVPRATLPRSFSAPYPPLEGIAEEGPAEEPFQWELGGFDQADWHHQQATEEDQVTEEEVYQHALRVEGYILGLIQRHTHSLLRPSQPRTTLTPDPSYCSTSSQGSLLRRTPSHTPEHCPPDPYADLLVDPRGDLSAEHEIWRGGDDDPLDEEACGGEAPSLEEDCYLALPPYPHSSRPHSLAGGLPLQSLPPLLDPGCGGVRALDLCCEPTQSPQPYLLTHSPAHHHNQHLVSAQYIPGQGCQAPVRSPRHYAPDQPKPDQPGSKPRSSKKTHEERQSSKRPSSKTSRSQSENSLLGQRGLPERRYSTTERPQSRRDPAQCQAETTGVQTGTGIHNGGRRWCSNLELSQDEGEAHAGQAHRRPPRRARQGHPSCPQTHPHHYRQHHHGQPRLLDYPERAPLCRAEEGYAAAAPGESESSMSEVYSPASSSLSSSSDESGGLVWPQQLPPRLAPSSSSSSSPPQVTANASSQPKAFVKIKASHALKKKILRFRSGSLKVMTTV